MKNSNRRNSQRKISRKRISSKRISRKRISRKRISRKRKSRSKYYDEEIKILLNLGLGANLAINFKINDYTLETFKEHIRTRPNHLERIELQGLQDFDIFDETGKKVESIEEFKNKKKYDLLLSGQIVVNTQLEKKVRLDSKYKQDGLKKFREVYDLEAGEIIEIVNKETGDITDRLEHGGNYIIRVKA